MAAHVRPSRGFCAVNPEDGVPTHEATMVAMARQLRPCNLSPETNMRCSATGARGARARVEGKQRAERLSAKARALEGRSAQRRALHAATITLAHLLPSSGPACPRPSRRRQSRRAKEFVKERKEEEGVERTRIATTSTTTVRAETGTT